MTILWYVFFTLFFDLLTFIYGTGTITTTMERASFAQRSIYRARNTGLHYTCFFNLLVASHMFPNFYDASTTPPQPILKHLHISNAFSTLFTRFRKPDVILVLLHVYGHCQSFNTHFRVFYMFSSHFRAF
jgi:hypothetical protein